MLSRNEEKLNKIRDEIKALGGNIVKAGQNIFDGLDKNDVNKFDEVKNILKNTDRNANILDNEIITSLALFGAEAADLRELISYLKITNELVRISDNMRGFAKNMNAHLTNDEYFYVFKEYAGQLCKSSISAVKIAINSISDRKGDCEDEYRKVKVEESKSDDLYALLEKNILSEIGKNFDFSIDYIRVLSTMRKLEKMADRSVAIVKLTLFAKSGGMLKLY